jgi:hypothetical protein
MDVPSSTKKSLTLKARTSQRATRKLILLNLLLYRLKYISKVESFLKGSGVPSKKVKAKEREFLDSLPFVIKHSLFMDDVMIDRMRELSDFGQQFFIADDTKIKGNKAYD